MTQQTAVEKPRTGFPGAQPGADAGAHRATDQLVAIKAVSRAVSESNVLENATEAVSGMPATRRRISVGLGLGLGLGRSIVTRAGRRTEIEQSRGDGVAIAVRIPS